MPTKSTWPSPSERKRPARSTQLLEARVDALLRARVELGVLDVKRLDALVIDVDEAQVVELLQQEMARVVVDVAARVVAEALEEHLEGHAVDQVLAGMELVADVDAGLVEGVEDRLPAPRELVERGLDQARRPRRPGIEVGPGERAGEAHVAGQAEPLRRLGGEHHLRDRPLLASLGVAAHLRCGEGVERDVVSRVDRDQLALQVARELGQRDAGILERALDLVAVGIALGGLGEVEQPGVPARDLHPLVAEIAGPLRDAGERVERRPIARELGEKDRRSLDGLHAEPSLSSPPVGGNLDAPAARRNGPS